MIWAGGILSVCFQSQRLKSNYLMGWELMELDNERHELRE